MRYAVPLLFAAAALGWSASTQVSRIGAFVSHTEQVRFDLPIDVDSNGKPRSTQELSEVRQHLVVPDFYGRLVSVTQYEARAVLWYQDGDGMVRNVVVEGVTLTPFAIEQRAASRVTSKVTR